MYVRMHTQSCIAAYVYSFSYMYNLPRRHRIRKYYYIYGVHVALWVKGKAFKHIMNYYYTPIQKRFMQNPT